MPGRPAAAAFDVQMRLVDATDPGEPFEREHPTAAVALAGGEHLAEEVRPKRWRR